MIFKSILFRLQFNPNVCNSAKAVSYVPSRDAHFNIIVAGGGLVGTAMACSLAKNPYLSSISVAVLEGLPKSQTAKRTVYQEYSNRVISLNPGTRKYLEDLGVWKYIAGVRYKTVKRMQVWDACSDAMITFNDDLSKDVSYIVENDLVLYALEAALKEESHSNLSVVYDTKIKKIDLGSPNKSTRIETMKGEVYTCNLLIGADGVKSKAREALGQRYVSWDYDQMGIVATLKLSEPTENVVAWQRFLPTGPIALLPLTDELSSLVWSTTTDEAKELLKLNDESFVDAVNNAFWKKYPKSKMVQSASDAMTKGLELFFLKSGAVRQLPPSVESVAPKSRAAFPLGFGHSVSYIGQGIALIGDAAHRVHPLAGLGVNLGFGDVKCLTEVLADGVYSGQYIGSENLLKEYQKERQKHNFPAMVAIDGLQKLYGTSFAPVVLVRTLGLQLTHALNPVKSLIMQMASR